MALENPHSSAALFFKWIAFFWGRGGMDPYKAWICRWMEQLIYLDLDKVMDCVVGTGDQKVLIVEIENFFETVASGTKG